LLNHQQQIRIVKNVECTKPIRNEIVRQASKGERESAKVLWAFLERCLVLDDGKRGKAEDVVGDRWIKGEIGYKKNEGSTSKQ